MLNKFQEQDLMASVEMLEDLRDKVVKIKDLYDLKDTTISFDEIIDTIKKIHPSLFNYPRVARYMEEGEIRGEITRKHIKKLNEEMKKKNANT